MKIEYRFVNDEKATVEVMDDFEKIMLNLDEELRKNDEIESKQHVSLNFFVQDKKIFLNKYISTEEQVLKKIDKEMLYKAIEQLKADEQKLIYNLYLSSKPMTSKRYASILKIPENLVKFRLKRVIKKLKYIILSNANL